MEGAGNEETGAFGSHGTEAENIKPGPNEFDFLSMKVAQNSKDVPKDFMTTNAYKKNWDHATLIYLQGMICSLELEHYIRVPSALYNTLVQYFAISVDRNSVRFSIEVDLFYFKL